MWIDWHNPPKSINEYFSGDYHRRWVPACQAQCRFSRPGWKFMENADPTISCYDYRGQAEVELDTTSNLTSRIWALRTRVILIRRVWVKPAHRRQGVMGKIIEEIIDQLPNGDLLVVLNPMEGNEKEMIEAMSRTYERLGFREVSWPRYLTMDEWYAFEERHKHKHFKPKMMARPADEIDHKTREKWEEVFV